MEIRELCKGCLKDGVDNLKLKGERCMLCDDER